MSLTVRKKNSIFSISFLSKGDKNAEVKEKRSSSRRDQKAPKRPYTAQQPGNSKTPSSDNVNKLAAAALEVPKLIDLLDVSVAKEPPVLPLLPEAVDLDPKFSSFRQDLREFEDLTPASDSLDQNAKFLQLVKSFEELERARTEEKAQHAETERQLQASRDRFICFEREMQRAMQSEIEKTVYQVYIRLDESQHARSELRREKDALEEEVKRLSKHSKEESERMARENTTLVVGLRGELKQATLRIQAQSDEIQSLRPQIQNWKDQYAAQVIRARTDLEKERSKYQALLENSIRAPPGPSALEKKSRELQAKVGAPVAVRHIGKWGGFTAADLDKLTPAMIAQMKAVTEQFAKVQPVTKIEYILNNNLYKQYEDTRGKFRKQGRGTKEVLVFHGTDVKNINPYFSFWFGF
jgi:hypothetical protein